MIHAVPASGTRRPWTLDRTFCSVLSLLDETVETKLESSAWMSACEKGQQWQRALSLLSVMVETKLEPTAISYNAWTSA
eukprot:5516275-Pyramimonas_sp.AAC.2